MIPEPVRQWIFWLNPLAAIGEMYRDVLLIGEVTHWREWGAAVGISLTVFLGGFWCYKKLRSSFADVL
ncbi:MAG: ABC transporter permease, partial [Phormidesmis sp.]